MAVLSLDFSAATDDLIPEGEYSVVVDRVEAKPSNNGPAPNLNWTFNITEGSYSGRKLFLTTGTSDKAIWKLKETLQALDAYSEGMEMKTDDASNLVIQPRLSGLAAIAKVGHREWEGRKRAGVESLKRMNGAGPNGPQFR